MVQSTPTNSYCSRASFRCAYMHHIEKYVFQQETVAPGLGLFLKVFVITEEGLPHFFFCEVRHRRLFL